MKPEKYIRQAPETRPKTVVRPVRNQWTSQDLGAGLSSAMCGILLDRRRRAPAPSLLSGDRIRHRAGRRRERFSGALPGRALQLRLELGELLLQSQPGLALLFGAAV